MRHPNRSSSDAQWLDPYKISRDVWCSTYGTNPSNFRPFVICLMPEQRVYQWLHYKLYCFGAQFCHGVVGPDFFADKMKVEWSKWVLALWSLMGFLLHLGLLYMTWMILEDYRGLKCAISVSLIRRLTKNMRVKKSTKTSTTLLSGTFTWDLSSIQKLASCRHA